MRAVRLFAVASLVAGLSSAPSAQQGVDYTAEQPVFRSSVEMVAMAAVVRNKQGRVVPALSRDDFEVLDDGTRRPIVDLRSEIAAPASIAFLVDSSGSMKVGYALDAAREVASQVIDRLDPNRDEAALLTFDSRLLELQPFTRDYEPLRMRLEDLDAYGTTSLYDAIAQAARIIGPHAGRRRAIVVLTDGADNSSSMTPNEVSGIASAIDVPVYVLAVGSTQSEGPLADLAHWTGGDFLLANDRAHATAGITRLMDELRHQYVIAFEPSTAAGWRHVEIRARRPGLTVRARSWYLVGGY